MKRIILIVLFALIASTANAQQRVKVQSADGTIINPVKEDGNLSAILGNQTDGDQVTKIIDSAGADLELIKENDNFNAASHGIIMYGLDKESNPSKYRQINADMHGHLRVHPLDTSNADVNPATSDNQTNGNQVVKGNVTPSDNHTNPTGTVDTNSHLVGYNPTTGTWYRISTRQFGTDGLAGTTDNAVVVDARVRLLNGTGLDRLTGTTAHGVDADVTRINHGKTVNYYQLSQAGAGTTQIVTASASNKHKIVGFCVSLDTNGTFLWTDGTVTSGAIPVLASVPVCISPSLIPMWETGAVNRALSITTATGKAFGYVAYITEP